jgi:hypothetical protein
MNSLPIFPDITRPVVERTAETGGGKEKSWNKNLFFRWNIMRFFNPFCESKNQKKQIKKRKKNIQQNTVCINSFTDKWPVGTNRKLAMEGKAITPANGRPRIEPIERSETRQNQ